jgi:pimeloyl-ACP methyl ester carboxylesterase
VRGYNLSSKPGDVAAYDTEQLTADIRGLVHERGAESALLVGHDWGGTVAWATAMNLKGAISAAVTCGDGRNHRPPERGLGGAGRR